MPRRSATIGAANASGCPTSTSAPSLAANRSSQVSRRYGSTSRRATNSLPVRPSIARANRCSILSISSRSARTAREPQALHRIEAVRAREAGTRGAVHDQPGIHDLEVRLLTVEPLPDEELVIGIARPAHDAALHRNRAPHAGEQRIEADVGL